MSYKGMKYHNDKNLSMYKEQFFNTHCFQIVLNSEVLLLSHYLTQGHVNSNGLTLEAGFTPDSKYVLSGSQDGTVHVWSTDTGEKVAVLDGGHAGPTHCVQFNPKLMTLATACNSMVCILVYNLSMWSVCECVCECLA